MLMQPVRQCGEPKADGQPCNATPMPETGKCFWHSSEYEEEAAQARRLGGIRRRKEGAVSGAYEVQGLETVQDIRRLLEIAVTNTLNMENSIARSHTLTQLAMAAMKLLEADELETRIASLEAAVHGRTSAGESPLHDPSEAPRFLSEGSP